jgi:hypothetical protein
MLWNTDRQETIVDSFEDGDIDEYTAASGALSDWAVVDESNLSFSAWDGSKVLEITSDSGPSELISTSGLDNYFGKGAVAEAFVRATFDDASEVGPLFGVADANNYYQVELKFSTDELSLDSVSSGSSSNLAYNGSLSALPDGSWVKIKLTWDDGTLGGSDNDITVDIIDPSDGSTYGSVSANNSDHASQTGVGWFAQFVDPGNTIWFDKYWLP